MNEMIERIGAVLDATAFYVEGSVADNASHRMGRDIARDKAGKILAAMREPTEAMIEASNREWDGRMSHRSSGAWQAMIDAALAGDQP